MSLVIHTQKILKFSQALLVSVQDTVENKITYTKPKNLKRTFATNF